MTQFATVHGVAHVMPGAVVDVLIPVSWLAHEFANHFDDRFVIDVIIVGADNVGFAQLAFVENKVNGRVVVVDMDPVAHLLTGAVEFWLDVTQDICDLAWDKLFDVLVGAVVVATVADRCLDAKAAYPGTDEVIGAGFTRRVGTRRVVGGVLIEFVWVVELEITEDFIGTNVVKAFVVGAYRFENSVGADNIALNKRPGVA